MRLAGRRSDALADIGKALAISRETGMAYMGPCISSPFSRWLPTILEPATKLLSKASNFSTPGRPATTISCSDGTPSKSASASPLGVAPNAMPRRSRILPVRSRRRGRITSLRADAALAAWGRGRRDDDLTARLLRLRTEGERLG